MIVYILGPYRSNTINGIANNIAEARRRAEWCWANGHTPVCPHMNSAFMDGVVDDSVLLPRYIMLMMRCDAIMPIRGWEKSAGSKEEYEVAVLHDMKVLNDPL